MDELTEDPSKKSLLLAVVTSRYRYVFGLTVFIALLVGVLTLAWNIPGQLSDAETQSALKSATVSLVDPSAKEVINLPYLLLQKASLHLFGITNLGIKLPSLLLGIITGLGLLWLLNCWLLRSSIALFSGVIAITSSQFLLSASTGMPLIMSLFWVVALLLLALKISANHTSLLWSLCVGLVLGLSLYTPLSLYLIISLPLAVVLHPHLRFLLRTIPKKNSALAVVLFLLVLTPLAIAIFKEHSLAYTLLGWPGSGQSLGHIKLNIIELAKSYLLFWHPQLSPSGLVPLFGLGSFCLIIFGALKLFVDHHSARSYSLAIFLPILLIPVVLQPQYAIILFVPFILLLAIGIEALLDEWYKLFPHNPYARVVALVPLMILLTSLVVTNTSAFANTYRYSSDLPRYYSQDLSLVRKAIQKYPHATVIVSSGQKSFYDLLRRDFPGITVADSLPISNDLPTRNRTIIVSLSSTVSPQRLGTPTQIITDNYQTSGPRFYVFDAR